MTCKHCGEQIQGTKHHCQALGKTVDREDDSAFFDSLLIGAVTDSTLIGAVLGGDILGAVIGDMIGGDDGWF